MIAALRNFRAGIVRRRGLPCSTGERSLGKFPSGAYKSPERSSQMALRPCVDMFRVASELPRLPT